MIVNRKAGFVLAGGLIGVACLFAAPAFADDMMAMKAPPAAMQPGPAPAPATCSSVWGFFVSDCQLSWYGVRFYGTIDVGGGYQTHGTPFDPNFPTGASYFLNKPNRQAEWFAGPNAMSQSNVGVEIKEPIAPGWAVVGRAEFAFDPYSGLLANAPQALQDAIHVPLNQQELPVDSSRWGWLAAQIYTGVSSPVWGTLTFGRQNSILLDNVNAYDPMGGAYGFSPIGFSGLTCGAGDTEECRWTTAIKYRVSVGDVRFGVMGQPFTYGAYNPNNGAIEGDIGGDIRFLGPGVLSLDAAGAFAKDAVNIGPTSPGTVSTPSGMPITFPATTFLQATISNNTSFMATAKYVISPVTLYAGYEWIQFAPPSDPQTTFFDDGFLFNAGVGPTGGAASANGTSINNNAFTTLCGTGTGCSDKIMQVMWTGIKYGITRDLDVIGAYYHYIQNQYVSGVGICANTGAHGQCAGTGDMASAVLDWRFLPKWDAYIGTFFSQLNGGLDNGYLSRNNLATTAGVRFKF
jgi:predicted porin